MMLINRIYRKLFEFTDSVGSFIRIIHLRLKFPRLTINFGSYVASGCEISCSDDSEMYLRDVYIMSGCVVRADRNAKVRIVDSYIGFRTTIVALESIEIADHCEIAEMVVIRDQDHVFGGREFLRTSGLSTTPIKIGSNVWVGAKASILRGVNIGDHSVIGAHAVVTKDVGENSVVVGIPARSIEKKTNEFTPAKANQLSA